MGDSLVELAERSPETNFLGVEVHRPGLGAACQKIHKRGLRNVRLVRAKVELGEAAQFGQ